MKDLTPDKFVNNSRQVLDKVVDKVRSCGVTNNAKVVKEWESWASSKAPATDNFGDYLDDMFIPFGDTLFNKDYVARLMR